MMVKTTPAIPHVKRVATIMMIPCLLYPIMNLWTPIHPKPRIPRTRAIMPAVCRFVDMSNSKTVGPPIKLQNRKSLVRRVLCFYGILLYVLEATPSNSCPDSVDVFGSFGYAHSTSCIEEVEYV